MPPRTQTETKLAPAINIHFHRDLKPDGSGLEWAVSLQAVVLDQNGEVVRSISADNILDDLTPAQRTALTGYANTMAAKMAARLEVTGE